jgi:NADH-quinone oxidoreductase subunit M
VDPANHWLLLIVALPVAVGLGLVIVELALSSLGLRSLPEAAWRGIGLIAALADLAMVVVLVPAFDAERTELQSVEVMPWVGSMGARLLLGVDGISLCFLLVTATVVPLSMLASRRETEGSIRVWVFACLLLESSLLGALVAANLLVFTFFWALGLAPILLWMGRWGGLGRARAASRVWTTEAASLAGLLFVAFVLRELGIEQLGTATLDLLPGPEESGALLDLRIPRATQWILFLVMVAALASRLPLAPLHFWLPAAHAASPTGLSMLIATGFTQTAAVGLFRFALPLFPDAAAQAGPALSALGIAALLYASLIALVQKELKRLIAYASIGYAGFAVFGIATLTAQGMTGAVVQLLTHGLASAGLFLLVGFLERRRETTEVAAFGGLVKPMPVCAFFFGFMVLSLMGLPMLGGFVGDLFVLLGSLDTRRELSVFALIAMVVAASYLFWVQRRLFLGPVDEPANRGLIDLDSMERVLVLVLAIPLLWIGIYPNPVLRRVEPAVLEVLHHMDRRLEQIEIPDAEGDTEMVRAGSSSDVKGLLARVVGLRLADPDSGTESAGEEEP